MTFPASKGMQRTAFSPAGFWEPDVPFATALPPLNDFPPPPRGARSLCWTRTLLRAIAASAVWVTPRCPTSRRRVILMTEALQNTRAEAFVLPPAYFWLCLARFL